MSEPWLPLAIKIFDSPRMESDEQVFIEQLLIQDPETLDTDRYHRLIQIYERIFKDYGKEK